MMKKVLYHSGFAILGVTLLVGMGVLQANGLKTTDTNLTTDEAAIPADESTPVADADVTPAPDATVAQVPNAPAADAPATAPMQVASLPTDTPAPAAAKAVKTVKTALDDATKVSIFDPSHKSASKKTFDMTAKGMHNAQAYYQRLAHHHKHPTIKAAVNGEWVSVSAKEFSGYIKNASER